MWNHIKNNDNAIIQTNDSQKQIIKTNLDWDGDASLCRPPYSWQVPIMIFTS